MTFQVNKDISDYTAGSGENGLEFLPARDKEAHHSLQRPLPPLFQSQFQQIISSDLTVPWDFGLLNAPSPAEIRSSSTKEVTNEF